MRRPFFALAALAAFVPAFAACAAASDDGAPAATGTEQDLGAHAKPPLLPSASGAGDLAPWGGSDPSRWRPEAVLANATSAALNGAWARPGVKDVVVAVPVKMFASSYSQYGDGQLNAVPAFGPWSASRPPVVATMIDFAAAPRVVAIHLDRALPTNATTVEIAYYVGATRKLAVVSVLRTADGDLEGDWQVPSEVGFDLLGNAAAVLHPTGWGDWFPIWFRMPVRRTTELTARNAAFSDGRGIFDREGVSVEQEASPSQVPYERLASHAFSVSYNGKGPGNVAPFNPDNIHARFPYGGGSVTTGVGQGWTWVADERPSGFKVMYTCFEARRPDLEAASGVPSGGGWHYIGDPAETIVNDLEAGPLVVGAAGTYPYWPSGLPSGGFAYGLTDVATIRWLYPGEAFVTPRGPGVVSGVVQDNYHWYFFAQKKNVCTEELVNTGAVPTGFQP